MIRLGPLRLRGSQALCLLISLLATACGTDVVEAPTESVVGVAASGCSLVDNIGTGVVVDVGDETLIVTTAHTVAGATEIMIEPFADPSTQHRVPADLVLLDPARDLAILSIRDLTLVGRPLAEPVNGAAVSIVTWLPDDGFTTIDSRVERRLIVTIEDIYVEEEVTRRGLELTASILPGHSGAPVFDDHGNVVGIIYARSRNRESVAFAVNAQEIEAAMIERAGMAPDPGRCT